MTKRTLKIFWCSYRKILKYVLPFFNLMHETSRVLKPLKNARYVEFHIDFNVNSIENCSCHIEMPKNW